MLSVMRFKPSGLRYGCSGWSILGAHASVGAVSFCCAQVVFHPNEPIVASASSDKEIYLGELA